MASKQYTWDDAEKIGVALSKKYPEIEPLSASLSDIHRWVGALSEFNDDPKGFDQQKLEAIQRAWNTEFLDRTQ
jgi:FeS assembly protein IscX